MNIFDQLARERTQSPPISTDEVRICMVWAYADAMIELNQEYAAIEMAVRQRLELTRHASCSS